MEAFGTSVFCDDIRSEVFNKASLMGVYGPELIIFGSFPAVLGKLGIFVMARFPKDETIDGAKGLVYLPGDPDEAPTFTHDFDVKLSADIYQQPDPQEYPDPLPALGFNFPLLFGPLAIRRAGYIRVLVVAGKYRIKAGSLKIRQASQDEMAALGVQPAV